MSGPRIPKGPPGPPTGHTGQMGVVVRLPVQTKVDAEVADPSPSNAPKADDFATSKQGPVLGGLVAGRTGNNKLVAAGILPGGLVVPTKASQAVTTVDGQRVLTGDVELRTRAQLRAFPPDVVVVKGSVSIGGGASLSNIDLLHLGNLQEVGRFTIEGLT
jgi:hypothetical protein